MSHLHFVQSLETLQGGGLGQAALGIHRALISQNVDSRLVATTGSLAECHDNLLTFRRIGPEKLFLSKEMLYRAEELVANSQFIHGHGLYVAPNLIFGRLSRKLKKPLIYHAHGFFEPWILSRSRLKKRISHLLFEDRNIESVKLWRALTRREAEQILAQGIRAPIIVAPNGIDVSQVDDELKSSIADSAIQRQRRRILFFGRIHPKKGLDCLLRAWSKLGRFWADWELVIVGPNEGGYLEHMIKLAGDLKISETVFFLEAVGGSQRFKVLSDSDVFILPSYSEGLPMAALEAMACSVPVVISDNCNLPEVAQAGAGWECAATDESVRRTLEEVLSCSSSDLERIGGRGRALIEKQYTWAAVAKSIQEACESL